MIMLKAEKWSRKGRIGYKERMIRQQQTNELISTKQRGMNKKNTIT